MCCEQQVSRKALPTQSVEIELHPPTQKEKKIEWQLYKTLIQSVSRGENVSSPKKWQIAASTEQRGKEPNKKISKTKQKMKP